MENIFVFEYSCKSLYVEAINKWLLETELHTCAKIDLKSLGYLKCYF